MQRNSAESEQKRKKTRPAPNPSSVDSAIMDYYRNDDERALARAALTGNLEELDALLAKGIHPDIKGSRSEATLLMQVAHIKNIPNAAQVMKKLVEHGADVNHEVKNWPDNWVALTYALYSDDLKPNWPAIKALYELRSRTTRTPRTNMVYDFFAEKPGVVVRESDSSLIRDVADRRQMTSYEELNKLHKITARQLKREEGLRDNSGLPPVLTDMTCMLALQQAGSVGYFAYQEQLRKDKQTLEQAMGRHERDTYFRLGSSIAFVGSLFSTRFMKRPFFIIGATSSVFMGALYSLFNPVDLRYTRRESAERRLSTDRMVLFAKGKEWGKRIKTGVEEIREQLNKPKV